MSTIIDVDFQVQWAVPVHVRVGNGGRERIDGPDAALSVLRSGWPSNQSPEFCLARERCIKAVTQHDSAELARESFLNAAVEAKVLA